jgi:hypothetical protein
MVTAQWNLNDPMASYQEMFAVGRAPVKTCWRATAAAATVREAVPENEEVVPVNASTWVLPSGVTAGR